MYTHCPSCIRQFRIRASQLALAEGLVQCGFCGKQFNALERLYDKPLVLDPDPVTSTPNSSAFEPEFYIPEDNESVEKVNTSLETFAVEMTSERSGSETEGPPAPEPETESLPGSEAPTIAELSDDNYPFPEELIEEESSKAGYVSRLFWSFGVLILFLAGVAQASWFNRDLLLSQYPAFLPQARKICQHLDCTLVRLRDISAIKLVNRDVRIHPRYKDALLVNATITNLSNYSQRFPTVLLSLFDPNGNVIAYRQIPASDYLDNSIDIEAGILPDSPIHFVFEIANSTTEAVSFEFDFL
ncbi:MAG: putative Zn finger-like uncharacterized protein [Gammaproteobacteria bacterium]|jgi:predicted Zn finger-like uncharacterized protein